MLHKSRRTCLYTSNQDVEWVVYTTTSYHVNLHRNFFQTYKVEDFGLLKMGNTSSTEIVGIGDVQVKTNVSCTIMLNDVWHMHDICLNLLLSKALDKEGYNNYFGNNTWKLLKGAIIVAREHICGTLYNTYVRIHGDNLTIMKGEASQNLWH